MTTSFQSIGKERIQTPAGTFDCIKVYSTVNGGPGVSISYYADGIGPVRQIMHAGGQEMIATLTSTNVKPPQRPRTKAKSQSPKKVAARSAAPRWTPTRRSVPDAARA